MLTSAHDSAAKTILKPSPLPLASTTPSLDLTTSKPKARFRPVLAPEPTHSPDYPRRLFLMLRNSHRGAHQSLSCLLPNRTYARYADLPGCGWQCVSRILPSRPSRWATHSTYVQLEVDAPRTYYFFPQAFKGHALADPVDCPGQADLTADVDLLTRPAVRGRWSGTSLSFCL